MIKVKKMLDFNKMLLIIVSLMITNLYGNAVGNIQNAKRAELKITPDTLKAETKIDGINVSKKGTIFLLFRYNESLNKGMPVSKKLMVINGKIIEPGTIGGIEDADFFLITDASEGIKKYGNKAEFGVIEAIGLKVKTLRIPGPPPSGLPPLE